MIDKNIFSTKSQKELKELYKADLMNHTDHSKTYDDRWTTYLIKHTEVVAPLRSGKILIALDKQSIEKEFWYGYSDMGQGMSYDECSEKVEETYDNMARKFMETNMSAINDEIKTIKDIINTNNDVNALKSAYITNKYYGQTCDSKVKAIAINHHYYGSSRSIENGELATIEDLTEYLTALKEFKVRRAKQLNTYLKKYGTSKMSVHTYWIDR